MYLRYGYCILIALMLASCGSRQKPVPESDTYLIVTREVIEEFDSSGCNSKVVIDYEYEYETDFYWKKANYKDSLDRVQKIITREFDDYRFPILETTIESSGEKKLRVVKYSNQNYELISNDEYDGEVKPENLIYSYKYNYDQGGYLITSEYKEYCNDADYKNVDANTLKEFYTLRYLPNNTNRPRGYHDILSLVESRRRYYTKRDKPDSNKVGDIMIDETTTFDSDGYPEHYKASGIIPEGMNKEEWYSIRKDTGGNILEYTSYIDTNYRKSNENCSQHIFVYDSSNMIKMVVINKYNDVTKKYDLFTDERKYEWIAPWVRGKKDYTELNYKQEHVDTKAEKAWMHSSEIVKIDEIGEKIIQVYEDRNDGQFGSRVFVKKLVKKITQQYYKFEKDANGGRISRRKD